MVDILLYYLPRYNEDGEQHGDYNSGLRHGFFIPPHDGKGSLNWIGPSLEGMVERLQQEVKAIPQRNFVGIAPSSNLWYEIEPLSPVMVRQVEKALNGAK